MIHLPTADGTPSYLERFHPGTAARTSSRPPRCTGIATVIPGRCMTCVIRRENPVLHAQRCCVRKSPFREIGGGAHVQAARTSAQTEPTSFRSSSRIPACLLAPGSLPVRQESGSTPTRDLN